MVKIPAPPRTRHEAESRVSLIVAFAVSVHAFATGAGTLFAGPWVGWAWLVIGFFVLVATIHSERYKLKRSR